MILGLTDDLQWEWGIEGVEATRRWLESVFPGERAAGMVKRFVIMDEGGLIEFTRVNLETGDEFKEYKRVAAPPPMALQLK